MKTYMKNLKPLLSILLTFALVFSLLFSLPMNHLFGDASTITEDDSTGKTISYHTYDETFGQEADDYLIPLIKERTALIDVSEYRFEKDENLDLLYALTGRYPEEFWYISWFTTWDTYTEDDTEYIKDLYIGYYISANEWDKIDEMTEYIDKEVDLLCAGIDTDKMSDAEIVHQIAYNIRARFQYSTDIDGLDLYHTLKRNATQCVGYSEMFRNILNRYHIKCGVVSTKDETHQFNIIQIDNKWYFADLVSTGKISTASASNYKVLCSSSSSSYNLNVYYPGSGIVENSDYSDIPELINSNLTYSRPHYYDGWWYYVAKKSNTIMRTDLNGTTEEVLTFDATWLKTKTVWDENYENSETVLSTTSIPSTIISNVGDTLYFNTSDSVIAVDMNTMEQTVLYTLSDSSMQNIISVAPNSENIGIYVLTYSYDDDGNLTSSIDYDSFDYDGHLVHTWKETSRKDATTTEDGYIKYTCSECGEKKVKYLNATMDLTTSAEVILDQDTYEFDADVKEVKPGVTVKDGDTVLTEDEDYTVEYEDAYKPGTYTVTVTGTGDYTGTLTAKFTITHTEDHIYDDGEVTKEATCTEDGEITYTCTDEGCDKTYTELIPATGHQNTEVINKVAATCTEDGSKGQLYCNDCQKVIEDYGVDPATGHTWDDGTVTKEATCTETGVKTYTCESCGETKTEEIEATGHSYDNGTVTKEATCTEDGVKTYTCKSCGTTKTEEISATGHSYDDGTITKEATCSDSGIKTYTCKSCGDTKTETIPATGHSYDEGVVTKEATCTETGVKTYTCETCGETKTEEIKATGHTWDDGVVTKEATCTETGTMTYTCESCGETKTEEIEKTGHLWDEGVVTTEPTCTEEGVMTYTCKNCGETKIETIEAAGHDYSIVTIESRCTEEGETQKVCSVCGHTETEKIAAKGHSWESSYTVDKKATCTTDGSKSIHCKNCDATKNSVTIPATGHSYGTGTVTKKATPSANGTMTYTCKTCGAKKTSVIAKPTNVTYTTSYAYTGKAIKPSVKVTDSAGETISSSNYTVSYSNNTKVGTAKIKVTFKGSTYSGSITKTFTITPKKTSISKLTKAKKAFTAKWKKIASQATGYQVRYSTSSAMKSAKTVTVKSYKTTSKKVSKLKSKKKYYVQVRTYKTVSGKKYYSDWSTAKSVTTK